MIEQIHTCNYECQKPECVLSQRDELVKRFVEAPKEWVGLTYAEVSKAAMGSVEGRSMLPHSFAGAIEKILKEKNHD